MPLLVEHQDQGLEVELGVIEEARRRRRRLRRRKITAASFLIAIAGAVLGVVIGGGSSGSSRRAAREPGRAAPPRDIASGSGGVRLAPALEGGSYGWEVVIDRGSTCCTVPSRDDPLAGAVTVEPTPGRELLTFLAGGDLAAVLLDGRVRLPVITRTAHLPFHLRLVEVTIPRPAGGAGPIGAAPGTPPAPAPPSQGPTPKLTALDSHGRAIHSVTPAEAARPIRWWERPSAAPAGPCQVHASGLGELKPQWGHVAGAIAAYGSQIIGRAFFSCIDTEYYLNGWPLKAAILLDAADPGRAPAAIPGMRPIPGAGGFLDGPGRTGEGGLSATRTGPGWLVLAGGSGRAQRLDVLRHLTARIVLPAGRRGDRVWTTGRR
jgi:hypothetical protein